MSEAPANRNQAEAPKEPLAAIFRRLIGNTGPISLMH